MTDQNTFTEVLREVAEIVRTAETPMSEEDIMSYFSDMDLSLGQKKFVMIALSLCEHADLYLWDEPLNYIDVYLRQEIERLVKDNNVTMLFVEHDRTFSESVADREVNM